MSPAEKRIWDLPVRLTHWGLVISFFGAFMTAELRPMTIHFYFAYSALTLVIFRVFWGVLGSQNARFWNFIRGPKAIRAYIADLADLRHREYWGHNPVGALAVVAVILLMFLTVGGGLFARSRSLTGPWADSVSRSLSRLLTEVHGGVASVLMTVVVIHITAILFYRFVLHDDLIKPMVTGKRVPEEEHPEPWFAPLWLAVILFALAVTVSGAIFRFWLL